MRVWAMLKAEIQSILFGQPVVLNLPAAPRSDDDIEIYGETYRVQDVIWTPQREDIDLILKVTN